MQPPLPRQHASRDRQLTAVPEQTVTIHGFDLPQPIAPLGTKFEDSRSMLALDDDWGGEGSARHDEATWNRAVGFLVGSANRLWQAHRIAITPPEVLSGPNGSVDLHWRIPGRELLVNVPADPSQAARYYSDDGAAAPR